MDAGGDAATEDWGPFGRPLFDDPSARALGRVGVLDVGSNSVRMVVFDGAARSPAYFFNEKVMAGLGAGMAQSGRLNPDGALRAIAAIQRFQQLAETMRIAPLTAVATAAVREAEDGPAFRAEPRRRGDPARRGQDRASTLGYRRRGRGAAFRARCVAGLAGRIWLGMRYRRVIDGTCRASRRAHCSSMASTY